MTQHENTASPKCTTLSKAPLAACKEECLLIQYYNQLLTAFTQDRDDRANYQREKGTGAAAAVMRGTKALQIDRYFWHAVGVALYGVVLLGWH